MLDFRMETFLTVCQCMNFTRASEKLNITQPAVSQHIHFLEKHYNTKLFRYEGKKLRLTGAGEILRNASLTMMQEEIRFGATRTVGDVLMGRILERYLRKYPDAKICMIVDNTQELLRKLDEGAIDFALVEGFFQKNEYDHQKYSDENYIAVCAPDYNWAEEREVLSDGLRESVFPGQAASFERKRGIEELFHERLLVREEGSGTREVLERCLDAQNFSIRDFDKVMEVGSLQTIRELTKAGCGITFLYETAVRDELREGTLKRIPLKSFEISHEFNFIWRRGSIYADRYKEIFADFLHSGF